MFLVFAKKCKNTQIGKPGNSQPKFLQKDIITYVSACLKYRKEFSVIYIFAKFTFRMLRGNLCKFKKHCLCMLGMKPSAH